MKPRTEVTEQELRDFVAAYPRELHVDVCGIGDPPVVTFNDFTLGVWPESVVASYLREWFDEPAHAFRIVDGVPESVRPTPSRPAMAKITLRGGPYDGQTHEVHPDAGEYITGVQSLDPSQSVFFKYRMSDADKSVFEFVKDE